MNSPSELNPGDIVASRYGIEALLGESPSAKLYLADENQSQRKLVLKAYRQEVTANWLKDSDFFLKAGMLPALSHDNLAVVYEIFEWEGSIFVAREFLEGPVFSEWLGSEAFTQAKGLELIWQASQSLGYLHEKGCHLNLHPGNVILDSFTAKLADGDPRLFSTGDSIASLLPIRPEYRGYTAPELRRSGAIPRPACDLYGLAGLFFRLISGTHPVESPSDLTRRIATLPDSIAVFLGKALHFDAELRYQSAEEFSDALWALQPFLKIAPTSTPSMVPKGGTVFNEAISEARKTEFFPKSETSNETLFGAATSAAFAPSVVPPIVAIPSPPELLPRVRKPLSSLESSEGGSTVFGALPIKPFTPKMDPPRDIPKPTSKKPSFAEDPLASLSKNIPVAPPLKTKFTAPIVPPIKNVFSSLESDSPNLTLSGETSSGISQYGFKNANSSQTLAMEQEQKRKSQKVLWISLAAGVVVILAFTLLFIILNNSGKNSVASTEIPALPSEKITAKPTEIPNETIVEELPDGITEAHVTSPLETQVDLESTTTDEPNFAPKPAPDVKTRKPNPILSKKKPAPPKVVSNSKPIKPAIVTVTNTPVIPTKRSEEVLLALIKSQNWPSSTEERLKLGDELNDYGLMAEANQAYSRSMELPGMVPKERVHALGGLAVTFNKMGFRDEALNALDQLLAMQPNNKFAKDLKTQITR